jgi:hypothetical protein
MNHSRLVAALVLAAGFAAPAMADTVSFNASGGGNYNSYSLGLSGARGYAGDISVGTPDLVRRGFISFSNVQVPAGGVLTAARLRIGNAQGYLGGTLNLWAYSGDASQLAAGSTEYTEPNGLIWQRLGSGVLLGSAANDVDPFRRFNPEFDLNAAALANFITATGGSFAFGLSLSNSFAVFSAGLDNITLELTYSPVQVVPLPPAVWGGAAGLAGVAFIARRRRMTAN